MTNQTDATAVKSRLAGCMPDRPGAYVLQPTGQGSGQASEAIRVRGGHVRLFQTCAEMYGVAPLLHLQIADRERTAQLSLRLHARALENTAAALRDCRNPTYEKVARSMDSDGGLFIRRAANGLGLQVKKGSEFSQTALRVNLTDADADRLATLFEIARQQVVAQAERIAAARAAAVDRVVTRAEEVTARAEAGV